MDPLPVGTVTLLFTDIEGSTALLTRLGDRYADALSAQRRVMRGAIAAWAGFEMGTEGDSFFVVFESAVDAVSACLQAQLELAGTPWPDGVPVRLRMGLHTGEPRRHEEGYVGIDLNRAARIAATAHGGQVVLSEATAGLVEAHLPELAGLADLGWHRLKDIEDAEHIFQLTAPGLQRDFPPLKGLGAPTSLPTPATPLVGRDAQLADLHEVAGHSRLLTLTGPGGVGKTRLALALAASLDPRFRDGVFFVPLATVSNADVMWKVLADTLGVGVQASADRAVTEHLAGRTALLVLDNLEQLAEAAVVVAALLAAAPRSTVLATSRRPLHLQGESEYAVPPLAGPAGAELADIAASGAVGLFVQQAALVRPGFSLTPANADAVAAICRRLDGLPLAIELAAARVKLLPPQALLARLGDSLDLATTQVDRPSRQQTLRAAIAWSHDLLSPELERAFRRMGVFAGGCDLDAVAAVLSAGADYAGPDDNGGDHLAAGKGSAASAVDPLQVVADLLDVSLLTVTETLEGDIRVGMLEMIREYAYRQLVAVGELDVVRRRHAEYYTTFAEQASAELHGPRQLMWLDRLETEHDNLRAALAWTLADGAAAAEDDRRSRAALGLRLVNALAWFWYGHGHAADGRRWIERAIEQATGDAGPQLAAAMHGLGVLLLQEGEMERARALLEQNLDTWQRVGDDEGLAKGLSSLGVALRMLDQPEASRARLEESIALARRIGSDGRLSTALSNLAIVDVDGGAPERAISLLREAIEIDRRLGDPWALVIDQSNLAGAMLRAGRAPEAHRQLGSLIDDVPGLGDPDLTANVLELLASTVAELGDGLRAAQLSGTAERIREEAHQPLSAPDVALLERWLGPARDRVSPQDWQAAVGAGRAMAVAAAIELSKQPV